MLEIKHIDAFYGKVQALYDVSLEVGDNEIISLIGANGAGKSTLMKTVMGLLRPARGEVLFDGEDLTKIRNTRIVSRGIVYVPEGREVFPEMTVRDNLEMGAYCRKYSQKEMNRKIEEMYDIFPRLKERQKQLAGSLSGGEQQRTAVARAMASGGKIVLADEPTGSLDSENEEKIVELLLSLAHERDYVVIMVTHNRQIAERADVRLVMKDGRMAMEQ